MSDKFLCVVATNKYFRVAGYSVEDNRTITWTTWGTNSIYGNYSFHHIDMFPEKLIGKLHTKWLKGKTIELNCLSCKNRFWCITHNVDKEYITRESRKG